MANFKDLHIEACEELARAMSKLSDYGEDFLFDRLQECMEEYELNEAVETFVSTTLEKEW